MDLSFLPKINWVDVIVVIFLIRGSYIGLRQGFSVELFKIFGAIAAGTVSLLYYSELGRWIASHSFLSAQIADFLSFLILFFVLLLAVKIIRIFLFKILHLQLFYGLEKIGGVALGLGRSVIFVSLFLFGLNLLPVEYIQKSIEEKSLSGPYVKKAAPEILNFIVRFKPENGGEQ